VCWRKLSSPPNGPKKNIRLLIAGDGPEISALKMLSKTEGIGHITEFTGSIPHSEVPEVLARMDVFVALSREESFGVAVVEAGAMGIPVVVSDRGGLPEVVLDRKTGIVVPSDNPEAAADAILELIENPDLRAQLGQVGRHHVAEHYAEAHCVEVMVDLYQRILDKSFRR
jgi:glycosyltransferase involved in cell wall biosynthesis